jgi:hypothetical protein
MAGGEQSAAVPAAVADLLLAASRRAARAAEGPVVEDLTARGVPAARATALARATAGLLGSDEVDAHQFVAALHAFNAVVDTAPAPVLVRPPRSFAVVRSVLKALLPGAAS